jgi:hypothetical protein
VAVVGLGGPSPKKDPSPKKEEVGGFVDDDDDEEGSSRWGGGSGGSSGLFRWLVAKERIGTVAAGSTTSTKSSSPNSQQ